MTQKLFGYPIFGYWKLFERENAADILNKHVSFRLPPSLITSILMLHSFQTASATSLFYPTYPETWRTDMGPIGAAEAWITSDKNTPVPSWLSEEEVSTHNRAMGQKGYRGPTNWYVSDA